MRLSTSKIIMLIIGCLVAGCIGTFAPQFMSPKAQKGAIGLVERDR
ncbi:MAG TPA: hypothetical protein VFZ52_12430 [Chryseolinea sp.]